MKTEWLPESCKTEFALEVLKPISKRLRWWLTFEPILQNKSEWIKDFFLQTFRLVWLLETLTKSKRMRLWIAMYCR